MVRRERGGCAYVDCGSQSRGWQAWAIMPAWLVSDLWMNSKAMAVLGASGYLSWLAQRPHTLPRNAPRDGLQALLAHMGHPECGLRCLHIGGSKGKGS